MPTSVESCQFELWLFDSLADCSSPKTTATVYADNQCQTLDSQPDFPGNYIARCDLNGNLDFVVSGCSDDSCGKCVTERNQQSYLYSLMDPIPVQEFQDPLNGPARHECFSFTNGIVEIFYAVYGDCSACSNTVPTTPGPNSQPVVAPSNRPVVAPTFQPVVIPTSVESCQFELWVFDSLDDCANPEARATLYADNQCRTLDSRSVFPGNYIAKCDSNGNLDFVVSGCSDDSCGNCVTEQNQQSYLYSRMDPTLVQEFQDPLNGPARYECFGFSNGIVEIFYAVYGDCIACLNTVPTTTGPNSPPVVAPSNRPVVISTFQPMAIPTSVESCQFELWIFDSLADCSSPKTTATLYADNQCRTLDSQPDFPGNYIARCDSNGNLDFVVSGCSDDSCGNCATERNQQSYLYSWMDPIPVQEFQDPLNGPARHECFGFSNGIVEIFYAVYGDCNACSIKV